MLSLCILNEFTREKLSVPVGCRLVVLWAKLYMNTSGDVTQGTLIAL